MLCNECARMKPMSTLHIINGKKTESHLCEECAKEPGNLKFKFFNGKLVLGHAEQYL